jgi:hypothetical protein
MVQPFPIGFDGEPRLDRVTVAVVPMDAFTGRIVTARLRVEAYAGTGAEKRKLPNRPVRNLSGLYVFLNLPHADDYTIELKALDSGYFDPDRVTFVPPADNDSDAAAKRRVIVLLQRRPTFAFSDGTTLIRGVVVSGKNPVDRAKIWADVNGAAAAGNFTTFSDAKGSFALGLRLPPVGASTSIP